MFGHVAAAAEFDVIAAREAELPGELLLVQPPRRVHVQPKSAPSSLCSGMFSSSGTWPPKPAPTVSMMYLPTLPLEFATPEFSRMRTDSSALAASTTTRAFTRCSAPVLRSM